MENKTDTCLCLLETIHLQDEIITKQNETIAQLVNENVEQENFINEIMKDMIE